MKNKKNKKPASKSPAAKAAPAASAADELDIDLGEGGGVAVEEAPDAGAELGEPPAEEGEEAPEGEQPPEEDETPAPAPKPKAVAKPAAKGGKGKAPPAPPPEAPADEAPMDVELAKGYEVVEIPVESLKLNKSRTPTPEQVARVARSIKEQGLMYPVTVGADGQIIDGNKRLLAHIELKRKVIPARFATDPSTGEQLTAKDAAAQFQTIIANVQRDEMTPIELGRAYSNMIKHGLVTDAASLAKKLGLPASEVSRCLAIYNTGSELLKAELVSGSISYRAAADLVSRVKDAAGQDRVIESIKAAADGKLTRTAVQRAAPRSGGSRRPGPKVAKTELSADVLKTDETGILIQLRKTGRKEFCLDVRISLTTEAEHLARYDVAKKIQAAVARLDMKEVRKELELARERLND